MKLSILVALAAFFILFSGFQAPALFFIGYLWASLLYPSAFITLPIPFSLLFGLFCIGSYLFSDREKLGRFPSMFYIAIAFAIWVTFTTTQAVIGAPAWEKWNWAIESIIITVACPLFLRSRAQLETAFLAAFSALSAHVLTAGVKSAFGSAGYDRLGMLMQTNNWLGETSTLALVAIMSIPMAGYAIRHSEILEPYRGWYLKVAFAIYAYLAVMCVVGTSARTGVIAFAALLIIGIKGFVRKAVALSCAALFVLYGQSLLPGKALTRFSSILTYSQDDSAEARVGVWKWARQYAAQHPFGGGFSVFYLNEFDYTKQDATTGALITEHMKNTAPHSIYFEVLGEQGYIGELLFLLLIVGGLWGTYRLSKKKKRDGEKEVDDWPYAFSRVLFVCLVLFCTGAAFVGIAFQPLLYVFLGFYCSLHRIAQVRLADPATIASKVAVNAVSA